MTGEKWHQEKIWNFVMRIFYKIQIQNQNFALIPNMRKTFKRVASSFRKSENPKIFAFGSPIYDRRKMSSRKNLEFRDENISQNPDSESEFRADSEYA